ncbi:MAG: energy transducer TonB [Bacteroidota bacterium]
MKDSWIFLFLLVTAMACNQQLASTQQAANKRGSLPTAFYKEKIQYDSDKKKDGQYEMTSERGVLLVRGQYDAGKKVGEWTFYDRKEEVFLVFDFDESSVVKSQLRYSRLIDGQREMVEEMTPSSPALGDYVLEVYKMFAYPKIAYENNVEGTNTVRMDLDESGQVVNMEVIRQIGAQTGPQSLKMLGVQKIVWDVPEGKGLYSILFPVAFRK